MSKKIPWENYRGLDGSLNLVEIFQDYGSRRVGGNNEAYRFIERAMEIQPIISRQLGAVIIALAETLDRPA